MTTKQINSKTTFKERSTVFAKQSFLWKKTKRKAQNSRGILTILLILLAIFCTYFNFQILFTISFLAYLIIFWYLIIKTQNSELKIRRFESLLKINNDEVARLNGDFTSLDGGQKHELASDHHFANDLELFGNYSVFQLVSRCETQLGQQKLANWLSKPTLNQAILTKRQDAIKELVNEVDWRQDIQAAGTISNYESDSIHKLLQWVAETNYFKKKKFIAFDVLSKLILVLIILTLIIFNNPFYVFAGISILGIYNSFLLRRLKDRADQAIRVINENQDRLLSYLAMIRLVDDKKFKSDLLKGLQDTLSKGQRSAWVGISTMTRFFNFFQLRGTSKSPIAKNMFYPIINHIILTDFYLLIKAERWKQLVKENLNAWFDAISVIESLNSFSALYFSNLTTYSFPSFTEGSGQLSTKRMGHPLINHKNIVYNDFEITETKSIALITGSNMAGKSTFLRTLGINMVLAYAGGPVCAQEMTLSFFHLFTSLRTQDNLQKGISSFQAELIRLEMLVKLAKEEQPIAIFFLLDEILKGTNAHDMHIGSENLIHALVKSNSYGSISTHDTELGKLEKRLSTISNYHFKSEIIDDEIIFDYKIRKGVCQDANASALMKKIGIHK